MQTENNIIAIQPYTKLFASVVLAALDDAILDQQQSGTGVETISRWARSMDGQTVLRCAGIEPSNRCIKGLTKFVTNGVKTSVALTGERRANDIVGFMREAG